MRRRLLAMLLAVLMLMSTLSAAVFAQEHTHEHDLSCYQHGDINNDGVIDSQDAVYALFHGIPMFQDLYPTDQDLDFNKDNLVNSKDAIHLLYAADPEKAEDYPLQGVIHTYSDPVWLWQADDRSATATVSFACSCGESLVFTEENGVTVADGHITEAGCVTGGEHEYVARVTANGKIYVSTYTVDIPAGTGHQFDPAVGCEDAAQCLHCEYEKPADGHMWVLDAENSTESTCYEAGTQVWTCSCGETKEVELPLADHQYAAQEPVLAEGKTCEYIIYSKCAVEACGEQMETGRFVKHEYTVKLTKEADCQNLGVKTYTCVHGDHSYTKDVDPNGVHKWDAGVEENGVIKYTCTVDGCDASQTAVAVQNGDAVSKDTLLNTDKVTLEGGASVSLDDATVNALSGDVKLSVEEADLTGMNIDADKLAQIGDNKVYDFKLSDATGDLSRFGGKITVSLPYELQEGDDIESIDIWYIDDDSNAVSMVGTYSNGYVTFETNHFSYYTVTRLTPAERCVRYGHSDVKTESPATCTEDGYKLAVCRRCGRSEKTITDEADGHQLHTETRNASCTEDGMETVTCENCTYMKQTVLPATGHNMVRDGEQSSEATCTEAGKDYYLCDHADCGFSYEVETSRTPHSYVSQGVTPATCSDKGYEVFGCETCEKEVVRNETAALGHDYAPAQNGWTWSDDHKTATLTLVCGNNSEHTVVLNAKVTEQMDNSVCLGGAITYTATVSYNLTTYTNTVTDTAEGVGHIPSNRWIVDGDNHYRICIVCGEQTDLASHTYGEKTVTEAPTCVAAGAAVQSCTVCGYEKTSVINATGTHTYEDGVCVDCGMEETGCKHIPNICKEINFSQYGACGGQIVWMTCACGQEMQNVEHSVYCSWGEYQVSEETLADGTAVSVTTTTCVDCGLTRTWKDYCVVDKNACVGQWYEDEIYMIGGEEIYNETYSYWKQSHPTSETSDEYVDLADYGLCSVKVYRAVCPCGEHYGSIYGEGGCEWGYNQETGEEKCAVCGAVCTWDSVGTNVGCEWIEEVARIYSLNGVEVYRDEYRYIYEYHTYLTDSMEYFGDSCTDGVKVVQTCENCGETEEYITIDHVAASQQVIDMSAYNTCTNALILTTCGCDEAHKDYYLDSTGHSWSYDFWYGDSLRATCMSCGTVWEQETVIGEKDADCNAATVEMNTWTDADGNRFTAERTGTREDHDYEVTEVVNGSSCEDGVTATYICKDCGYKRIENYSGHRTQDVDTVNLADHGGCDTVISWGACACGAISYFHYEQHNCSEQWVDGDENSTTWKCTQCGIAHTEVYEELGKIDACHIQMKETIIFAKDGVELFRVEQNPVRETHREISELTLNEGATSCTEGYTVKSYCLTCGETFAQYDSDSNHSTHPVEREYISIGQLCGDLELVTRRCACGQREETYLEWNGGDCHMEHTGYENGYEVYHCDECGVTQKIRYYNEVMEGETCRYWQTENYVFIKDGQTLVACDTGHAYWNHGYEYTFQLNGTTCSEGFTANGVCVHCGETISWTDYGSEEGHHNRMPVEYLFLEDHGACAGTVVKYQCPCGEESHVEQWNTSCSFTYKHWDETDLNGVHHNCYERTCSVCGLVIKTEEYEIKLEGCRMEGHTTVTYTMGQTQIASFTTADTWDSHDMEPYAVSLINGGTCEDGVTVYQRCVDCGLEDWYETDWHVCVATASEDLTAYGSVCGGKLELVQCACGEYMGYEFSADTLCDLNGNETELWIENAVTGGQHTTEGYQWANSEAILYSCPVTDPEICGLKIRMASYWLKEGCELVQYELWQLGYDPETDTCQKELSLATGERMGFHDYDNTWTTEELDEHTHVNTDSYVCPDCGSTWKQITTYIDGSHAKNETYATNTLNNGEATEYTVVDIYDMIVGEYRLITSEKTSRVQADGTNEWWEYIYSYPFESPCRRQVSWSNYYGDSHTYEEDSHYGIGSWQWLKQPTCSQHGEEMYTDTCAYCDIVIYQSVYSYDPYDHSWWWSDELQCYICGRCGLESINGGYGSIVLEDLTDSFGNGTDYVIGYWNRGEIAINPYVGVVLYDVAEGENDELVLAAIDFRELSVEEDGVRALAFEQQMIQDAAAEAMEAAGYTGSYAIRINFVPVGSSDTLDYSITFDSQTAE